MVYERKGMDSNRLDSQLDLCPYCGSNILKGAMRCVSCGRILKTPEEQSAAVREMMINRGTGRIRKIIRLIFFFIISGAVYYRYSDLIQDFLSSLLNKYTSF